MSDQNYPAPQPNQDGEYNQNNGYYAQQPYNGGMYNNQIPEDAKSNVVLMSYLAIFFGILPGLIFWLINKDKPGYEFTKVAAAENFNFSLLLVIVNTVLAFIPVVGWVAWIGVWIYSIVCFVGAANAAKQGQIKPFPFKIPALS